MNVKKYRILLAAVAAAVTVIGVLPEWLPGVFASMFAFPFGPIGDLLALIAGTGAFGNGCAFFLLAALSALPLLLPCVSARVREDRLLSVASAVLAAVFAAGYFFLLRADLFQRTEAAAIPEYQALYRAMAGGLMWSGVVAFCTVLVVSFIRRGDTPRLLGYGALALYVTGGVLTAQAALPVISACFALVRGGGTAELVVGGVTAVLSAVPYVFTVGAVSAGGALLLACRAEETESVVPLAKRAAHRSLLALLFTAASALVVNLIPFLFGRLLDNVRLTVYIPLAELVVSVAVLLVSALIERNRALEQDNDLFI